MKIFAYVALFSLISSVCWAGPIGKISKLNGGVSIKVFKTADFKPAKVHQQLVEGDRIRTGKDGWVELKLVDESRLTLANNTELELTSLSVGLKEKRGVLNLAGGKMRATVTKLSGQQADIRVKSPTAVAGIKGTEFLMLSRGPANVFFGNEGTVGVSGSDGKEKPLVPMTMTQTTRGQVPVEPVKVEKEPALAEAKAVFEQATASAPPADWAVSNNLPNIIARWNVQYGGYLADRGNYQEALQIFQVAFDLTDLPQIKADARNKRGGVNGRFLNQPQAALDEYLEVLKDYPDLPQAETALYGAGQAYYDMRQEKKAAEYFRKYLVSYPNGEKRNSVETMLQSILNPANSDKPEQRKR